MVHSGFCRLSLLFWKMLETTILALYFFILKTVPNLDMVLGNLLYWKTFWAEGSTKLDHPQMCLPNSTILWLEGVVFCLACSFLQKYSHTCQSCKPRPRVLFSHAHFVKCWPQGTEACQIGGGKERHTDITQDVQKSPGKTQFSSLPVKSNKHPAGCKVSSRALADVLCAAVGPPGAPGLLCLFLLQQGSGTDRARLMWIIRRIEESCQ